MTYSRVHMGNPPDVFICLAQDNDTKCNVEDLCVALEWCYSNNVRLVSLSMGSTYFGDARYLWNITEKLFENGIILIAGASNDGLLTYPASLENCIGVCYDYSRTIPAAGFAYRDKPINGIEVVSSPIGCQEYSVRPCNSLSTAFISGTVGRGMRNGKKDIRKWLKLNAFPFPFSETHDYIMGGISGNEEKEVLRIAVGACSLEYVSAIQKAFILRGYSCAVVSDFRGGDISNNVFAYDKSAGGSLKDFLSLIENLSRPDIMLIDCKEHEHTLPQPDIVLSPDNRKCVQGIDCGLETLSPEIVVNKIISIYEGEK